MTKKDKTCTKIMDETTLRIHFPAGFPKENRPSLKSDNTYDNTNTNTQTNQHQSNVGFWRGRDRARCAVETEGRDRTSRLVESSPKIDIPGVAISPQNFPPKVTSTAVITAIDFLFS